MFEIKTVNFDNNISIFLHQRYYEKKYDNINERKRKENGMFYSWVSISSDITV